MHKPIKTTARKGMRLVVISVLLTSPLLSLLSVALLPHSLKMHETVRFISELGAQWGGLPVELAVVGTASVLLLLAANILAVDTVMMGVSRRSAVYHMLRGHVANGLTRRLPQSCHLLLFN